jgi:hypothetical protein
VIGDSGGDSRIIMKAQETAGGITYTSTILFYDDDNVEVLSDTDVDNSPSVEWDVTGGVVVTTLATCTSNGTLTQTAANFATAIRASSHYALTFDLVNTGFVGSLALSGIRSSIALPITTGTHTINVGTQSVPTDFILTFVRSAGTLTIDNISLTSPTLRNIIGLHASTDLGGTGFRPLMLSNGLWVNQSQSDADTRVSGQTVTDLVRTDASADAVIVGGASAATGTRFQIEGRTYLNGGQRIKRTSVTDATLDADHFYVAVDSSAATRTITLPATDAATIGAGKMFIIKRNGTNNVAINTNGSNTIDGGSSQNLPTDNATVTLVSNGGAGSSGDWEVISNHGL